MEGGGEKNGIGLSIALTGARSMVGEIPDHELTFNIQLRHRACAGARSDRQRTKTELTRWHLRSWISSSSWAARGWWVLGGLHRRSSCRSARQLAGGDPITGGALNGINSHGYHYKVRASPCMSLYNEIPRCKHLTRL